MGKYGMLIKFWLETPKGKTALVNDDCKRYRAISLSYSCTDVTILPKNPTNALVHVYTALFTLLHCYMFRPSRGYP